MNRLQKEALIASKATICKHLSLTEVLVIMESNDIFNTVQSAEIKRHGIEYERNSAFVDALVQKAIFKANIFDVFISSLVESNQIQLADRLQEKVRVSSPECSASVSASILSTSTAVQAETGFQCDEDQSNEYKSRGQEENTSDGGSVLELEKTQNNTPTPLKGQVHTDYTGANISSITISSLFLCCHINRRRTTPTPLQKLQEEIRSYYSKEFRRVNPLSLDFTFDIEKTWVNLMLEGKEWKATQNHCKLLTEAFQKTSILVIEGPAACGKTSLARRVCFDWAKGRLPQYDLVLFAEFRSLKASTKNNSVNNINNIILYYMGSKLCDASSKEYLADLLGKECALKTLYILDGYDEASFNDATEVRELITPSAEPSAKMKFDLAVFTRPDSIHDIRGRDGRFTLATILGFNTSEQKLCYLKAHFNNSPNKERDIESVRCKVDGSTALGELAKIPLFLLFICLVHEKLKKGTIPELYEAIICWIIDRHQKKPNTADAAISFKYVGTDYSKKDMRKNWLKFRVIKNLCKFAHEMLMKDQLQFSITELRDWKILEMWIVVECGLMITSDEYNEFENATYTFPHKTIQEYLSATYYFTTTEDELDYSINTESCLAVRKMALQILLDNTDSFIMETEQTKTKHYCSIQMSDEVTTWNKYCIVPVKIPVTSEKYNGLPWMRTFHTFRSLLIPDTELVFSEFKFEEMEEFLSTNCLRNREHIRCIEFKNCRLSLFSLKEINHGTTKSHNLSSISNNDFLLSCEAYGCSGSYIRERENPSSKSLACSNKTSIILTACSVDAKLAISELENFDELYNCFEVFSKCTNIDHFRLVTAETSKIIKTRASQAHLPQSIRHLTIDCEVFGDNDTQLPAAMNLERLSVISGSGTYFWAWVPFPKLTHFEIKFSGYSDEQMVFRLDTILLHRVILKVGIVFGVRCTSPILLLSSALSSLTYYSKMTQLTLRAECEISENLALYRDLAANCRQYFSELVSNVKTLTTVRIDHNLLTIVSLSKPKTGIVEEFGRPIQIILLTGNDDCDDDPNF